MSVQQEHATSETATLTTTESGGVYQSLFDKINLTPVSSIQEIDLWQNSETLADASPDERVTAAIHVLLSCLAKSGENVVKLDKSLLDFHIDDLDQKISKQLDAVMHHPEFQKVESLWRGTWFVVQRTDFRKNVRIELLDISKEHLRQDFDDSPEIIQSGLYRHTYIQEYDTPGGEPVASLISSYEFDNSPQDIALLRNISRVSAASHMPFIGSVGPKFFLKNSMTLDSNGFAGEGDITLFGELLHRFFALYADIHLFTQLTLILQPTGKCLQWTEHHSQRVPG